jgi:hypothetical protein
VGVYILGFGVIEVLNLINSNRHIMPAKDSIEELIKQSKLAAQKLGLEATGNHRKEPNQKRQFEIKNPVSPLEPE